MSAPDQNNDDLTAAYMAGFHRRDDEVKKLKEERDKLQRRADELEAAANNASSAADFTEAPIAYAALRSAITRYNQLKGKE